METRSWPSLKEMQAKARDIGLKCYLSCTKSELYNLLRRHETLNNTSLNLVTYQNVSGKKFPKNSKRSKGKGKGRLYLKHSLQLTKSSRRRCWWTKPKQLMLPSIHWSDEGKTFAEEESLNKIDPIMLTELGPTTFRFKRSNGTNVLYNVDSLVKYILATGNFSEPETRIPFSVEDLKELDALASEANLSIESVHNAFQNQKKFEDEKIQRDGMLGLERCAGEVVTQMLHVIEKMNEEDGQMMLLMELYPNFTDLFYQIQANDSNYSNQCIDHYLNYLKGPPNRPTVDKCGLKRLVIDFIASLAEGRASTDFGF